MAEESQPNHCPTHPELQKEFYCESCKLCYCMSCYKLDKAHKSKIAPLSEKLLENYEFIKFLGGGTYGKCFKVKSLADDKELALKVISDVDDEMFKVIKKEAQMLCSLTHKNVVSYTHSERIKEEEIFFILMELAEGCLLDKIETMSQEDAFKYFKQIADGLYYLHVDRGIIHRDLKPGNILMNGDDCKICDLGEAKKMTKEATKLSNAQGFGTEAFLPPEVFEGKDYGFKADIWSLGIIFYKMLTNGGHPFNPTGVKDMDLLRQSVRKHDITISEKIKNPLYLELLKGCLAHEEKDRFSIKEVLECISKSEKPKEEVKKTQSLPQQQKPEPTPITYQNTVNLEQNQEEEPNLYGQQAHEVSTPANKVSASAKQNSPPTKQLNYGQQQPVYNPAYQMAYGSGIGVGGFPMAGAGFLGQNYNTGYGGQNYNTGYGGQNFNVGGGYAPQNQQDSGNQDQDQDQDQEEIDNDPQNQQNNVFQQQQPAFPGVNYMGGAAFGNTMPGAMFGGGMYDNMLAQQMGQLGQMTSNMMGGGFQQQQLPGQFQNQQGRNSPTKKK